MRMMSLACARSLTWILAVGQGSRRDRSSRMAMRAVMLRGPFPADASYVNRLAESVDLVVYGTTTSPAAVVMIPHALTRCRSRSFTPVTGRRKGHLYFSFPGLHRRP